MKCRFLAVDTVGFFREDSRALINLRKGTAPGCCILHALFNDLCKLLKTVDSILRDFVEFIIALRYGESEISRCFANFTQNCFPEAHTLRS